MKKLLYISVATLTMTFSGLVQAAPNPLSQEEMTLVISGICSVNQDYTYDEVQQAIKESDPDSNITDSRINELADVAMMMQMMPGNTEILCSQPLN